MHLPELRRRRAERPIPMSLADTGLRGRWQVLARAGWVVVAVVSIGLFVASIPAHYDQVRAFTDPSLDQPEAVRAGLVLLGFPVDVYAAYKVALKGILATVYFAIALLIFYRKSDEWMALLFSLTLLTFGAIFPKTIDALATVYPGLVWRVVVELLNLYGFFSFFVFFYLFPDGRFVPRWTWMLGIVWIALGVTTTIFPGSFVDLNTWPPLLSTPLWVSLFGSCLGAQIYRYRHVSDTIRRQQTKWVVFGFATAIIGFIAAALPPIVAPTLSQPEAAALYDVISGQVYVFAFLLIPLSVGVSILRYRLWDIDPIINRTLVYGALTLSIVGIYVLVVGYLGALFRTESNLAISLVATGIVAVLFQPLRERFQRGVNRLMYGERDEPYAVLSRLDQRLAAMLPPDAVLPTIVETVKDALKLPYAAIALRQDQGLAIAAASGSPASTPLCLPLVYKAEAVGELLLASRSPGEAFSPADERLLEDLAQHASVVAYSVLLTRELQRSRERLVTTREEERRRLRRDLHDGLGPQLASLTLTLAAARELLVRDPAAADALLHELGGHAQAAIVDVRRVIYQLRPPALDDLGLVAALREQTARVSSGDLQVSILAPERLPPLAAAIEVAAYRIVMEAFTNVLRHAQARTCHVMLALEGPGEQAALTVEVQDDGCGIAPGRQAGVGLQSMRERAVELGGTCVVEPVSSGGTRVHARLPLGAFRAQEA